MLTAVVFVRQIVIAPDFPCFAIPTTWALDLVLVQMGHRPGYIYIYIYIWKRRGTTRSYGYHYYHACCESYQLNRCIYPSHHEDKELKKNGMAREQKVRSEVRWGKRKRKKKGRARDRTGVAGNLVRFKIRSDNPYTTQPGACEKLNLLMIYKCHCLRSEL